MYFSWSTDHKKAFKSLSSLTFPWKLDACHVLLERVCFSAYIWACTIYASKKNHRPAWSECHAHYPSFSRNKGVSLQKIYLQKVTAATLSYFPLILCCPALSLYQRYLAGRSVLLLSVSHQTNTGCLCFPKQPELAAICLSHLIWLCALFPGSTDTAPMEVCFCTLSTIKIILFKKVCRVLTDLFPRVYVTFCCCWSQ